MFDIERYTQAVSVADAAEKLRADPESMIISGGTDVLIKVRGGRLAGCSLVSIHGLPELVGVRRDEDGVIHIGPATCFTHITANPIIQKYLPMLGEAVNLVGGPQTRTAGTIGGNLCNGATSADSAPSLMALEAVLVLTSADRVREVPIGQFYTGPGRTVRERTEVLTDIKILSEHYEGFFGQYMKYGKRNAMEISTLGTACMVKLSSDKTHLAELRIAYGVAAPTPIRCPKAEAALAGEVLSADLGERLGELVLQEMNPRTSWRASKEFRLQIAKEQAKRAFVSAVKKAGGVYHA